MLEQKNWREVRHNEKKNNTLSDWMCDKYRDKLIQGVSEETIAKSIAHKIFELLEAKKS